jgi:hypothetical protein
MSAELCQDLQFGLVKTMELIQKTVGHVNIYIYWNIKREKLYVAFRVFENRAYSYQLRDAVLSTDKLDEETLAQLEFVYHSLTVRNIRGATEALARFSCILYRFFYPIVTGKIQSYAVNADQPVCVNIQSSSS